MKRIMSTITVALSMALTGCITASGPGKPKDPYQVENAKAFKGKNKVAIGSFKISFVTFDKSSSKASGSMASPDSGFAKATLRAKLEGVDDATFQAITDQAYKDLIAQLESNGYTVVDRSAITGAKSYSKLKTTQNPHEEEVSMKAITGGKRTESTFAPTGLPLYHVGAYGAAPQPVPFQMYAVASESGIPILNVDYLVHFAYFQGKVHNGDDKQAQVNMGQGVRMEYGSQMGLAVGSGGTFSNPNGTILLTWGDMSDMAYGTTTDATSGSQKAANAFSGAVGLLSGGSMSAKEYTITADPAKYRAAAMDVFKRTNTGFVNKLVTLK